MPKFDPQIHHRRSIRLKEYDYSQSGGYFVTMVTWQREYLFGEIINGEMKLNEHGHIADECWREIPNHFSNVELGAYVIMPNHVHGIIVITERRGTGTVPNENVKNKISSNNEILAETLGGDTPPLRKPTLGQIVAYFKYQSTKQMNVSSNTGVVTKFWQRNYYEHVIRNEKDLQNKTDYIEANPRLWDEDDENPINVK
jgi:REP element-mobilizing transposase RayT